MTSLRSCLKEHVEDPYRCYSDEVPTEQHVTYRIQLLEQSHQNTLSQRPDVTHITKLSDSQKLVYLGAFSSKQSALAAIDETDMAWKTEQKPLLVRFDTATPQPKIRLIQELVAISSPETRPSIYKYSTAYALQLAAFKAEIDAINYAATLSNPEPVCRQKDNGLYAVYHSTHSTRTAAQQQLKHNPTPTNAYIVTMKNVQFTNCNQPLAKTNTDKNFTVQLAAFKDEDKGKLFVKAHSGYDLICRFNSEGYLTIGSGRFLSKSTARKHLNNNALFAQLGAYVTSFDKANKSACP